MEVSPLMAMQQMGVVVQPPRPPPAPLPPSASGIGLGAGSRPQEGSGARAPEAAPLPAVEEVALQEERQWYYKDASGNVQGPFTSSMMSGWSRSGCFPPDTLVRGEEESEFSELGNGMRLLTASLKADVGDQGSA